jgi:hypothetical protein
MSIGVKYYSGGKRKAFDLDGVPSDGSEADTLLRSGVASGRLPRSVVRPLPGKVKTGLGDVPEFIGEKLGGSLVESLNGKICLQGEEHEMQPEGRKVYGTRDGQRGWFGLSEIDAAGSCVRVGPETGYSDTEADTTIHRENGSGFDVSVIARTVLAQIEVAGTPAQGIYAFSRVMRFTPGGRLFEIGPEKRQLLGLIRAGSGNGAAEWACTPAFDGNGKLTSLTFENAAESVTKVVPVEECEWAQ